MSDEENMRVYGKCNNPNGHGHNYKGQCGFSVFCVEVAPHILVSSSILFFFVFLLFTVEVTVRGKVGLPIKTL